MVYDGWAVPDTETHMIHALKAGYQNIARNKFLSHVERKGLCLDIGAHIGTWAKPMSEVFETVICFEPVPEHIDCLKHNCPDLQIHEVALGHKQGTVRINHEKDNTGHTHVHPNGKLTVECRTLDSFGLSPDFIKIDVENYELKVLQGAAETIDRSSPLIIIEQKRFDLHAPQFAAKQFLEGFGYKVIERVSDDYLMKR
jgi:FkbM family methyltransferase